MGTYMDMMIVDRDGFIVDEYRADSLAYLDRVVAELAPLFALRGWTWSGTVPTTADISDRCFTLIYQAAASETFRRTGYARISGGRIAVELRRADQSCGVTFHLSYMLGTEVPTPAH